VSHLENPKIEFFPNTKAKNDTTARHPIKNKILGSGANLASSARILSFI